MNYCRVSAEGITHLFIGLDFGAVCACGRKTYAFAVEAEEPTLCDVPQVPPRPWLTTEAPDRVGNARFLL